MPTAA